MEAKSSGGVMGFCLARTKTALDGGGGGGGEGGL